MLVDIAADAWLLGGPIYMLLRMSLPWQHTRLLIFIFATSILTTLAGLVHAIFIFERQVSAVGVSAHAQVRPSLL